MTTVMSLQDRGRALENRFALDQELEFKITAKATSLVAQWAADRIGLDEHQSAKFVSELGSLILIGNGQSLVKQKLLENFASNSVDISEHALERLFFLKAEQARKQVLTGTTH